MKEKIKTIHYDYMMLIVGTIIIFAIGLYDLEKYYCLTIINDEFSYWANAAQMAGKDWTSLLSTTSFYSYGYSFLLVPLFWLGISMTVGYRIAIVMNVLLLAASFLMAVWLGTRLFAQGERPINRRIIIFISFVVTLYISNIFQLTVAWTEIPLYFMFWTVTILMYRVIYPILCLEKPKYIDAVFLAVSAVYIYAIHNRAIGVTVTVFALILFIYIKSLFENKPQHRLLIIFFVMLFLFICASLFRAYTIESWYGNSTSIAVNDYSGQTEKVKNLIKFDGLIHFLFSLSGKIFYQAASSFLLVLLPVIAAVGMVLKRKKHKEFEKWNIEKWMLFFCSVAFTLEVGIAALYKAGAVEHLRAMDVLFGRYPEFAIGPLLLFAFAMILMKRNLKKELIIGAGIYLACALSVGYQLHKVGSLYFNINNATGLYRAFSELESPMVIISYITMTGLGGFILIVGCLLTAQVKPPPKWTTAKTKWVTDGFALVAICIISLNWCINGITISNDWVTQNGIGARESILIIEEAMAKLSDDTEVYYVLPPNDTSINHVKIYQSLDPDRRIHLLAYGELDNHAPEGNYVYMSKSADLTDERMIYLERVPGLVIFVDKDSEIYRHWQSME